jgi:hypothetical protein
MAQPTPNPAVTIDVLLEDPRFVIVAKPPGVVTEPGLGHLRDSLMNGAFARWGTALAKMGESRDHGLLHRLDRDSSGAIVIAFDAGGIKDWLIDGHNGHLVPWMDRAAFAAGIDDLLCNKAKARELGQNGLQFVSERYDFDGYISDLEQMFEEVSVARLSKAEIEVSRPTKKAQRVEVHQKTPISAVAGQAA